jgi:hypothetical protein
MYKAKGVQVKILSIILLITYFSTNVLANTCNTRNQSAMDNYQSELYSFCKNPYSYICGNKNSKKIAKQFAMEQEEIAARDIYQYFESLNIPFLGKVTKLWDHKYFQNKRKRKYEYYQGIKSYIYNLILQQIYSSIKNSMPPNADTEEIEAYEENIQEIISEIKNTPVIFTYQHIQNLDVSPEYKFELEQEFLRECGTTGFKFNAAVTRKRNPFKQILIICPGIYEDIEKSSTSVNDSIANFVFTLSHELAHVVDITTPLVNSHEFLRCLKNKEGKYNSIKKYQKWVLSKFDEILADQWAVKSLNLYLQNITYGKRLEYVARSTSVICGAKEDSAHPSAEWRISNILGGNKEIRKTLGCDQFEEKKEEEYFCDF